MRDHIARFHDTTIDEPEAGHLGVLERDCDAALDAPHRTTADGFACPTCKAAR